jgi:hypothetical protein
VPWRAIAATGIGILVAFLPTFAWLPGIDPELAREALFSSSFTPPTQLSVGAISVMPFISGFVLVECVARLVPRWRPLRFGDAGRATLFRAAVVAGVVLGAMQALMLVAWLRGISSNGMTVVNLDANPGLMAAAVLGGSLVAFAGAQLISRHGAGNGMSWVLGLIIVGEVVPAIAQQVEVGWRESMALPTIGVVVASVVLSLRIGRPSHEGAPQPAGGVLGVQTASALVAIPFVAEVVSPGTSLATALLVGSTAAGTSFFVWLMYRPAVMRRATASHWQDQQEALLFAVTVVVIEAVGRHFFAAVSAVGVVIVAAIVRDIATELRFRWQHGDVSTLCRVDDLVDLDGTMLRLADGNVDVCASGQCHRLLGHFFMPYVPITLLVPAGDVDRAQAVLCKAASGAPFDTAATPNTDNDVSR